MTPVLSVLGAVTGVTALGISLVLLWKVRHLAAPKSGGGTQQHTQYYNAKLGIYVDRIDEANTDIQPVKLNG